ncbi:hypothetical protein N2152v2_002944 [Parachlorella kessleri]
MASAAGVDTTLESEVGRLRAENEALRRELAKLQQCAPEQVLVPGLPTADGTGEAPAAAAAPAAGGTVGLAESPETLLERLEAGIVWPQPGSAFWEQQPRTAPLPVAPPAGTVAGAKRDPRQLHIVHITAEMAPVAKASGAAAQLAGAAGGQTFW